MVQAEPARSRPARRRSAGRARGSRSRRPLLLTAIAGCLLAGPATHTALATSAHAAGCGPWMNTAQSPDVRAHELVAAMTIDQKVALTAQADPVWTHYGVAGYIPGQAALCIPDLVLNDAGQGVGDFAAGPSPDNVTAYPAPIAQAASWDPVMQNEFGAILGYQAFAKGINVQLAPAIEVQRTPLVGRNWEYYTEDPYLAGQTAAAVSQGLQSRHVIATLKHYVTNSQENNRMTDSSDVDERTMHEIYLPPYETAIRQGQAGAVMCSYNRINSVYACENPTTLRGDLNTDLGFPGFVMSDWGATHSTVASAKAGLDMDMNVSPSRYYGPVLKSAVQAGQVPESILDDMVLRITRTMFAVGLFDNPLPSQPGAFAADVDTPQADAVALQVAENGAVLLKNDAGTLPLPGGGKRIAVVGYSAGPVGAEVPYNGGGSGHIPEAGVRTVTNPLQSMEQVALGNGDVITYADGSSTAAAAAAAAGADIAVVFAYDSESEGTDRSDLTLPPSGTTCTLAGCVTPAGSPAQDQLIEAVAAANPHTVVVLTTGGPVVMPWLDHVQSVLEAWYPGQEQGDAIAALLFGLVTPSGKLPETFPRTAGDMPTAGSASRYPGVNVPGDGVGPHSTFSEGLGVGYRWYDDHGIQPLFPFGHGLSYTTFSYANLVVDPATSPDGPATVSFDVTDTGSRAGAEVAQVYVGAPAPNPVHEPLEQLRGYRRVALQPGQTARVSVPIDSRAVSYWDAAAHRWTTEAGCHPVLVGSSSRDIRLQAPGLDASLHRCGAPAAARTVASVQAVALPDTAPGRGVPAIPGTIAGVAGLGALGRWRRRRTVR